MIPDRKEIKHRNVGTQHGSRVLTQGSGLFLITVTFHWYNSYSTFMLNTAIPYDTTRTRFPGYLSGC